MSTTDQHPIVIRGRAEAQEMWHRIEQYGHHYYWDHMLPRFDWKEWKRTPPGQRTAGEILKPGVLFKKHGRWEDGLVWQVGRASAHEYCCCDHCYPIPDLAHVCRWCNQHPSEWVFPTVSLSHVYPDSGRVRRRRIAGYSNFWVAVDEQIVHLYWPATWLEIVGDTQPILQQSLFEMA